MLRSSALAIVLSFGAFANGANAQDAPVEAITSVATSDAEAVVNDVTNDVTGTYPTNPVTQATPAIEAAPTIEATPAIPAEPAFSLQDALASGERAITAEPIQEKCITIMNGFPDAGHEPRYQFFKLTQQLTNDVTPTMRAAIDFYGDSFITPETPVIEVIENIANPVYRQAAPEITIGNMGYLIDFALDCESYLDGQISSLEAFDSNLNSADFHTVIGEDALFMRQILSDSLFRLGANEHEIFGPPVLAYADQMVRARDAVEFASFESQMANLEASFMSDLDGRLARSNDVINNEMDREQLAHALEVTKDLNEHAKLESKRKQIQTLAKILGGGY